MLPHRQEVSLDYPIGNLANSFHAKISQPRRGPLGPQWLTSTRPIFWTAVRVASPALQRDEGGQNYKNKGVARVGHPASSKSVVKALFVPTAARAACRRTCA
jgi:hypothetical protein